MQGIWIFASALTLAATCSACPPDVYVDVSAPSGGDGASWATAFNDLQDAVQCPDARVIHVAQGTYGPGADQPFVLHDGVTILGGYPAGGGQERDPALYETTLIGGRNDLVRIDNCVTPVLLDGLTLSGIRGTEDGYSSAILVLSSNVTVKQCRVIDNLGYDNVGVGIHALGIAGQLKVVNCHFEGNASIAVDGCIGLGGAISTQIPTEITGSTFIDNHTSGSWCSGYYPTAFGGAIHIKGEARIFDCYFEGNSASSSYDTWGGAVAVSGKAIIGNCLFVDNSVTGGSGGAVSTTSWGDPSDITIFNCAFDRNHASSRGGAIAVYNQERVQIANSTFINNTPDTVSIDAGGAPVILNSILRGTGIEGEIVGNDATVLFSNVTGGYPGRGNIDVNPMLDLDYRLLPGSPCIDAGTSSPIPAWLWGDLDRNPRKVDDPNTPNTGRGEPPIDMGAFEFQP